MAKPVPNIKRSYGRDTTYQASGRDTHPTHCAMPVFWGLSRVRLGCASIALVRNGAFASFSEGAPRTRVRCA